MTILQIHDFTGGLNTQQAPNAIKNNEATIFKNFVVDTFGVRVRNGFRLLNSLAEPIITVFPYKTNLWLVITQSGLVYVYDKSLNAFTQVGSITFTAFPKFAYFDPYVCVACGSSLYLFDTTTNTITQTTSPTAVDVLVKDGRVWICGGDEVWASRVGDPTDWVNNANDTSSAQFFQVGYKDGGTIVGFTRLYDDIIVFKTSGLFRIQGQIPNITISLITRQRTALNNTSYASVKTEIIAYDHQGAYRVSTTFKYGDLNVDDIDLKVKDYLKSNYDGKVFYLPSIRALAFKTDRGFLLWFYQFKAWVEWDTQLNISILKDDGKTLLGFGDKVYEYSGFRDAYSPLIYDTQGIAISDSTNPIYDDKPIEAIYRSKRFVSTYPFVIKRVGFIFSKEDPTSEDIIRLTVGKAVLNLTIPKTSQLIYDTQGVPIYGNFDPIFKGILREVLHKHQIQRVNEFYIQIEASSPVIINGVVVEYNMRRS